MAVYLLNLGFSMQPQYIQYASFKPYASVDVGLAQSCAWFVATVPVTPPNWGDVAIPIPNLNPANWAPYPSAGSNSDNGNLPLNNLDYFCVRFFQIDAPGTATPVTNLRPSLVFGNATANSVSGPNYALYIQSPLRATGNPRPIVDFDNAMVQNFPAPCTVENANGIATTWAYCLGQIHAQANDAYFSINAGATAYAASTGGVASFGHDPIIKVKGGVAPD